jgi:hypothetical protein
VDDEIDDRLLELAAATARYNKSQQPQPGKGWKDYIEGRISNRLDAFAAVIGEEVGAAERKLVERFDKQLAELKSEIVKELVHEFSNATSRTELVAAIRRELATEVLAAKSFTSQWAGNSSILPS